MAFPSALLAASDHRHGETSRLPQASDPTTGRMTALPGHRSIYVGTTITTRRPVSPRPVLLKPGRRWRSLLPGRPSMNLWHGNASRLLVAGDPTTRQSMGFAKGDSSPATTTGLERHLFGAWPMIPRLKVGNRPQLEGGRAALPSRPPAGGPLGLRVCRAGAAAPRAWTSAPRRRVLLVEGWDEEAEGSEGHWVRISHGATVRCLVRGGRPLAPPRDPLAAAGAVRASVLRVYVVWYAVLPGPEAPQPAPQRRYPWAGGNAHARAWLAVHKLVEVWRRHRGVVVVFHLP